MPTTKAIRWSSKFPTTAADSIARKSSTAPSSAASLRRKKPRGSPNPRRFNLIFTPGLSTADHVTEISGRGVGLDVVQAALSNLKGSIELESELGKGTTFRLLVPLTLASIQALLFRVAGRLYAVPLASVVEITRIADDEIHRVDDHEVFQLREQVLTLVRLDRLEPPRRRAAKRPNVFS